MGHNEAIRIQAAERYLLGELTAGLRDQFEEHAMGCRECADDLKAGVVFIESMRENFRRNDFGLIGTIS